MFVLRVCVLMFSEAVVSRPWDEDPTDRTSHHLRELECEAHACVIPWITIGLLHVEVESNAGASMKATYPRTSSAAITERLEVQVQDYIV